MPQTAPLLRTDRPHRDPWAPGLLQEIPAPDSVVVFRPGRIGDLVCAGPALRSLRAAVPRARLTLVALELTEDLAARLPGVDEVVAFPGFPGIAEQLFDAGAAVEFLAAMQARRFDLAVQLYGSGSNANPVVLLLGARRTAGFVRPGDGPGRLDAALPFPHGCGEATRALRLVRFLGAPAVGRSFRLALRPGDRERAAVALAGLRRPVIGLHTGARADGRRWDRTAGESAARQLRAELGGTIVLLGGPEERCDGGGPDDAAVVDLRGRLPLAVAAAALERFTVLLTTDSGPAHLAYAAGTPTVTVTPSGGSPAHPPPPGPHVLLPALPGPGGLAPGPDRVTTAARSVLPAAAP